MTAETTSPAAAPTLDQPQPTAVPTAANMTDSLVIGTAGAGDSIRPFRFEATDEALADLRRRVAATIFPERELVDDSTQGVQLATMEKLAQYWATQYDWRTCEARLNAYPQFLTEIDGLDIHFLHVRSRHENALPIIVTHGWPGSVVEQIKIIDPLVDPTAHGGSAEDAFHVVIPSIPGYGFSGKPTATGWGPERIATAWTTLMKRLGYDRFVAQGGDWGALITQLMAAQAPPELLGIHTNMPGAIPPEIAAALASHVAPPGLAPDELHAFERVDFFYTHGLAYALEMAARPQTLYGIADSPVGLAAWFLDHDLKSYELIARVFDDVPEGLSKDDVLDNITISWLTNTGVSGARLYWENKLAFFNPMGITIPVAVSAFPDELYQCPQSWAEQAFPKLIHYNKLPKGCHFAAWEQPGYFVDEVRTGLRTLR